MTGVLPAGFPHSDIHGSLDICSSPWLFAAYHVFHRLSVPRHPPCALSCLTFLTTNVASFVGSVLIFRLENLILIYEFICIATDCYLWWNTFMFLITWLFFRTISSIDVYSHFDSMNQLWIIKKYLVSYLLYTVFKVQYLAFCLSIMTRIPSGDGEIRTLDPLLARQVLSQLSYTPRCSIFYILQFILFLFHGLKWTRTTDLTLIRRAL